MDSKYTSQEMAMLAVAAAAIDVNASDCPSDEVLSAYINGELSPGSKREITAHLNCCSRCREQWLEICQVTASVNEKRASHQMPTRFDALLRRIQCWFTDNPLPVAAVACTLLVLVLMLPGYPSVHDTLDEWQSRLGREAALQPEIPEPLPLPWENTALAFNPALPSTAQKALGAGLWQSQVELAMSHRQTRENPFPAAANTGLCCWEESQWRDYYLLGRWLGLLWWQTALINHDDNSMNSGGDRTRSVLAGITWTQHQAMLDSLRGKLSRDKNNGERDSEQIPHILTELDKLAPQLANPVDTTRLNRQVLNTIHRLGPAAYE